MSYKLTYFNIKGLGHPIRFMFFQGGVPFEDNRIKREDWEAMKPTTPMGQMPLLEVDGKIVCQTAAICRFVGKKTGL